MERQRRDSLELVLIKYKGDLETAEQRLQDAKSFKYLRAESEKEQEISTIKQNVEILKYNIGVVESQLR